MAWGARADRLAVALVGREPEGAPLQEMGLGWISDYASGQGDDTITSGIEGAWTPNPIRWDMGYFDMLFGYEWKKVKSPAGAWQWTPKDIKPEDMNVAFQPIVDLASGAFVKFEVLARWRHPERGLLVPADFLPWSFLFPAAAWIGWNRARGEARQWTALLMTWIACTANPAKKWTKYRTPAFI